MEDLKKQMEDLKKAIVSLNDANENVIKCIIEETIDRLNSVPTIGNNISNNIMIVSFSDIAANPTHQMSAYSYNITLQKEDIIKKISKYHDYNQIISVLKRLVDTKKLDDKILNDSIIKAIKDFLFEIETI